MKKYKDIQQNTPEWEQLRKTRITGTILKSLMGTSRAKQEAIYEAIANRLLIGVDSDNEFENPIQRGQRLEPDAIAAFELEKNIKVERIGFAENDENAMIANSPDGLIGETEAVEAKCMGGKNHVKMWLTNEVSEDYKWQVVQYFIVNEKLEKLYFVGYNPDIPVHPLHIIEVNRKDIKLDIVNGRKAQEAFLLEVDSILSTIIKI